jgi:hypothetical protein
MININVVWTSNEGNPTTKDKCVFYVRTGYRPMRCNPRRYCGDEDTGGASEAQWDINDVRGEKMRTNDEYHEGHSRDHSPAGSGEPFRSTIKGVGSRSPQLDPNLIRLFTRQARILPPILLNLPLTLLQNEHNMSQAGRQDLTDKVTSAVKPDSQSTSCPPSACPSPPAPTRIIPAPSHSG